MRSTCSAVPARPTARRRSSVSGVATRVSSRTLAYDNSPRASACDRSGSVPSARARAPDIPARGAGCEAHAPRQPRRARAEAIVPAAAGVELADKIEQARCGRFQVHRQLSDLITETIELDDVRWVRRENDHDESPFGGSDSTPEIRSHLNAARTRDQRAIRVFRGYAGHRRIETLSCAGRPGSSERSHSGPPAPAKAVKRKGVQTGNIGNRLNRRHG